MGWGGLWFGDLSLTLRPCAWWAKKNHEATNAQQWYLVWNKICAYFASDRRLLVHARVFVRRNKFASWFQGFFHSSCAEKYTQERIKTAPGGFQRRKLFVFPQTFDRPTRHKSAKNTKWLRCCEKFQISATIDIGMSVASRAFSTNATQMFFFSVGQFYLCHTLFGSPLCPVCSALQTNEPIIIRGRPLTMQPCLTRNTEKLLLLS